MQLYERTVQGAGLHMLSHWCCAAASAAAAVCCSHRACLLPCNVQLYERILKGQGFPYFVNGAGGQSLNSFKTTPEPGETQNTTSAVTATPVTSRC
jgi:hypothetical protein